MNKKISGCAYRIVFDELNLRFFLLSSRSMRVFDWETNTKITSFKDIDNSNQIVISHKNGVIIVKTTEGQFAFYSVKELSFLGKINVGVSSDSDFYYDEDENIFCGIVHKSLKEYLCCVFPQTMRYFQIPLAEMECEVTQNNKPITPIFAS